MLNPQVDAFVFVLKEAGGLNCAQRYAQRSSDVPHDFRQVSVGFATQLLVRAEASAIAEGIWV
jgi:hypothetical protein